MKTVRRRSSPQGAEVIYDLCVLCDLCGYSFLYPTLMPERELQQIPQLFPADAIACHERVDRILNIAMREYPLPSDSRRIERLQDERLQR